VTDLGTYGFDERTGEMTLLTLHPGVTVERVRENTGWDPKISDDLGDTRPPTDEELRIVRELDPAGVLTS
jgi:glutaconate CoA-transferase subunit B